MRFGLLVLFVLLQLAAAQEKPRMGLCITGQLMRMELWSKLVNLLRPNMHDYDIDVLFVLDPESNLAVNERRNMGLPSAVLNESDIIAHVARNCPTCTTAVDFYTQPANPSVVYRYVVDMDKGPRNYTTFKANRAMVHARLFHSWSRCLAGFRRDPKADYDVYLRVRDDLLFPRPTPVTRDMWEKAVGVMNYCNCGGVNDKAVVLDAQFAHQYFVNPLSNMLLYYDEIRARQRIRNSETMLQGSLLFDRVPLRLLALEQFPFIVSRRKRDGSFCIAENQPKVGTNLTCLLEPAREWFHRFRCSRRSGIPDAEDWWVANHL